MKVILKSDVKGIGRKFDIKEVRDGYGRNFLIARGLAELATGGAMSKLEHMKNKALGEAAERPAREAAAAAELKGKEFKLSCKANEKGHLFEAVHALDIEKLIGDSGIKDAFLAKVDLPEPIKSIGTHQIPVKVGDSKLQIVLDIDKE